MKFSGDNDPGFAQLPGTLVYSADDIEEVVSEDLELEFETLKCPVLTEVAPGIYSVSQETETLEAVVNIIFDENFLDSFNFVRAPQIIEFGNSNLRFLTPAEIVAALEKQVGNATVRVALQPSVRRALDLINYTGSTYNLSPSIIENIETLSNGRITATLKTNLFSTKRDSSEPLQVAGFNQQILRRFVNNRSALKSLVNGENINESDLRDPDQVISQNIRFKFVKPKNTFFSSQRRVLKFPVNYTITRFEESDDEETEE